MPETPTPSVLVDLHDDAALPAPLATTTQPEHRRVITYVDTADDDLRRAGVRLRREQSVEGSGWILDLPGEKALRRPDAAVVPTAFADLLLGLRRGRRLGPVARTTVCTRPVDSPDGTTVADETVEATVFGSNAVPGRGAEAGKHTWRRVRIDGAAERVRPVRRALTRSGTGARVTRHGDLDRLRPLLAVRARSRRTPRAADLVTDYLGEQIRVVVRLDPDLRRGHDVVHGARVAIRRLRSTLRVFGALFDPDAAAALDAELAWYATVLGAVRDHEVLGRRLNAELVALPPELVLGPVAARLHSTLTAELARARTRLDSTLRSARYRRLLDTLVEWSATPPLTARAQAPARTLRRPVDKARRRVQKRLAAGLDHPGADAELHSARKGAKRLRYAVELAGPALTKEQRRDRRRGERIQTVLGDHQDAVVAAEFLRRLGTDAGRAGENGFTFGLLLGAELERERSSRQAAAAVRWG